MKKAESYLSNAFVISSIYLLAIIFGGFFIIPGVFDVQHYNFPPVFELFLKVTCTLAALIVISSAITIPYLRLAFKSKEKTSTPAYTAAVTLFIGFAFIILHAVYVKLRTCPADGSREWHCQVDSKSYVGMLILAFFLASFAGLISWTIQKLHKRY